MAEVCLEFHTTGRNSELDNQLDDHVAHTSCPLLAIQHNRNPTLSTTTMSFLDLLLVLLSAAALSNAHNIQLHAHSRECFHETLHTDDKMTVTFQVGDRDFSGGGSLDIDFWV